MSRPAPPTGFLGLSHLGLVSSVGWASLHGPVVGIDTDRELVAALQQRRLPTIEPGLAGLLEQHQGQIRFSTSFSRLADCPLVFVAIDVPIDEQNRSDPSVVYQLAEGTAPHLMQGVTLVLMSQVAPGFSRQFREWLRALRPDLAFQLVYWVETLVIGNAVERFLRPERIILGFSDAEKQVPAGLQAALDGFGCPVLRMSYESAELTKMAVNLYLCSAVTYTNTLADLCERLNADWSEIVPALQLDRRIGPHAYLRPSLGISGGHLERDVVALRQLSASVGADSLFLDALIAHNERRYRWVHRQLQERVFGQIESPTICVWGLAYKKDTDSTRNSIALRVIHELAGKARIRAFDPAAMNGAGPAVTPCDDKYAALEGADCLLIMTDWDEFQQPDWQAIQARMRRPTVIDCVSVVRPRPAQRDGVTYIGLGAPAR